jgi:hypothetical protein
VEPGVTFDDTVALGRDHGFQYLVFNYLAPEERLGLDFYRALANKLNSAGLLGLVDNHKIERHTRCMAARFVGSLSRSRASGPENPRALLKRSGQAAEHLSIGNQSSRLQSGRDLFEN